MLIKSFFRSYDRMSFSLFFINRVRKVAVLVMGRMKREIIILVSRVGYEFKKWFILGVLFVFG